MVHFRFYEAAAPFPGACVFSGETTNLWEVGSMVIQGQGVPVLLSDRVLVELATFAGFVTKKIHEETVAEQAAVIARQEAQLAAAPTLVKELTDGINNLLSNFVTDLAGIASANKPLQPESNKADAGSAEDVDGSAVEAGQAKGSNSKPSAKSASK